MLSVSDQILVVSVYVFSFFFLKMWTLLLVVTVTTRPLLSLSKWKSECCAEWGGRCVKGSQ